MCDALFISQALEWNAPHSEAFCREHVLSWSPGERKYWDIP